MKRCHRLDPLARRVLWGGERLGAELGLESVPGQAPVGESLEVSGLASMPSTLPDEGGLGLDRFWQGDPGRLIGQDRAVTDRFPLLIKRIDSSQRLSVQVHPDDEAAARLEGEPNGKNEAWVILEAEVGATIHLGLKEGVSPEAFGRAARAGTALELMRPVPVAAGDVIPVPAGCVHAIGAGIYLYEVQQPSDLTYRLYDYDRLGPDGARRPLHLDRGVAAIVADLRPEKARPRLLESQDGSRRERLCDLSVFELDRWLVDGKLVVAERELVALWSHRGDCRIRAGAEVCSLAEGRSLLIAAGGEDLVLEGAAEILVARPRLAARSGAL
ncbi:MAG: class I mannose-6-phosphate isomerase [Planctomycetes bacterium]|nr:class I mannose-6-phosphate isomerase [Planctomycetota bacterium]